MDGQLLERARSIADGLLWPNVAATDAAEAVPAGHLDALADAGLYGLGTPAAPGGLEADLGTVCAAIELLSSADLTTTFIWAQHLGAIQALASSPDNQLQRSWLPGLCAGQIRAGLILALRAAAANSSLPAPTPPPRPATPPASSARPPSCSSPDRAPLSRPRCSSDSVPQTASRTSMLRPASSETARSLRQPRSPHRATCAPAAAAIHPETHCPLASVRVLNEHRRGTT